MTANRQALLLLAGLLLAAGFVLGIRGISSNGNSCGSVFMPSSSAAKLADSGEQIAGTLQGATPDTDSTNNQVACKSALSDAKPITYGALGLGVLALIALLAVSRPEQAQARGSGAE